MARRLLPLVALLALVFVQAAAPDAPALLGLRSQGRTMLLSQLDPVTLAPLGRSLDVGQHENAWSFSPDRARLALVGEFADIAFVDTRSLRIRGHVRLPHDPYVLA